MLRVTVTLSYCIVHAYVDVDDDEVYGSVVTYMYVKLIQIHIISIMKQSPTKAQVMAF